MLGELARAAAGTGAAHDRYLAGFRLVWERDRGLADSPALNRVRYLDVSDNGLRPPAVDLLRARFGDALVV